MNWIENLRESLDAAILTIGDVLQNIGNVIIQDVIIYFNAINNIGNMIDDTLEVIVPLFEGAVTTTETAPAAEAIQDAAELASVGEEVDAGTIVTPDATPASGGHVQAAQSL